MCNKNVTAFMILFFINLSIFCDTSTDVNPIKFRGLVNLSIVNEYGEQKKYLRIRI